MSLTINHQLSDNVQVIHLEGRLTLGNGNAAFRQTIRDALDRNFDILVDLSAVAYLDSAGLGELVGSYASAKSRGREMKLMKPSKRVGSMLQITKLYTTFEVFEDELAALASFRNQ